VADHLVHEGIFRRHVGHREGPSTTRRDELQRAADRGQHTQRQHVHLEQPERVEIVLVPLDHRPLGHGRVLDRHQLR